MTKAILNIWVEIERKLTAEHGPFRLFGLFMKEEVWDMWYVLVSAPWVDEMGLDARLVIAREFADCFSDADKMHLSGIQLFDKDHPSVQEVLEDVNVTHGRVLLKDFDFDGITIGRAYIITAQVLESSNEAV